MKTIKDFIGRVKTPLRFKDLICDYKQGAATYPAKLRSLDIIVTHVRGYGSFIYIHYCYKTTDGKLSYGNCLNLNPSSVCEELVTEEGLELLRLYDDYLIDHLPNMLGHNFYIGADPEIFIEDKEGQIIPAFKFLPSKAEATKIVEAAGGKNRFHQPIYWDGYQAEFEVQTDRCLAWVCDSIQAQLKTLQHKANEFKAGAKLSSKTMINVSLEELSKVNPEHVAFGCMPSYNIYNLKGAGLPGEQVPFRSAGGHIHFGLGEELHENPKRIARIVKALDAILAVACVSMFETFDKFERRTMYGMAGEYRLPEHGLEYRVLSNAWLCHPLITNMVIDLSRKALMFGHLGLLPKWKSSEKETIETIQNCDVTQARKILERNKDLFLKIVEASYRGACSKEKSNMVYDTFFKGIESIVANPHDIVNNWRLNTGWKEHCSDLGKNVTSAFGDIKLSNETAKVS